MLHWLAPRTRSPFFDAGRRRRRRDIAGARAALEFHPGWVTRSVTSHDPDGGNGDGAGAGVAAEAGYHVLFHARGEGRILRLWMTTTVEDQVPLDYRELWIQIDGQTVYRGAPLDFFQGHGPWKAPLVLAYAEASGAFLSYVPFPCAHEVKILFDGDPRYYQITYREGPGASEGGSAEKISDFLTDEGWKDSLAPVTGSLVSPGCPAVIASGPATISRVQVRLPAGNLSGLSIRVGAQDPVPPAYFFGLGSTGDEAVDGGWASVQSSIHHVDPQTFLLATRLPIPLQAGESLQIEASVSAQATVETAIVVEPGVQPGLRLVTQLRDQPGPDTETTMPFFESSGATHFVALVEEITGGRPGDRSYLEGDEMIRTDNLSYPFQLGTGTEDYFNAGWYFLGPFTSALSGLPRFAVNDPGDGWTHARFEHALYRDHVLDPIVGRAGLRFGFEAGAFGAYPEARYRTLGLAGQPRGVVRDWLSGRVLRPYPGPMKGGRQSSARREDISAKADTARLPTGARRRTQNGASAQRCSIA